MGRIANRTREQTHAALLKAACDVLDAVGESGLRIAEVAQRAGVTTTVIHQHFGDRQGLVTAALVERIGQRLESDAAEIEAVLTTGDPLAPGGLAPALARVGLRPVDRSVVWDRIELLAASRHNTAIARRLSESQAASTARYLDLIERGKAAGLVDRALDSHALAVFVQAYMLGRVLGVVDTSRTLDEAGWHGVISRFIGALAPRPPEA
jgi:AcrR family transcriptional regulator